MVDIIDTVRLFSVKTLQYLLFTAIGLTWNEDRADMRKNKTKLQNVIRNVSDVQTTVYKHPGISTNFSIVPETGTWKR